MVHIFSRKSTIQKNERLLEELFWFTFSTLDSRNQCFTKLDFHIFQGPQKLLFIKKLLPPENQQFAPSKLIAGRGSFWTFGTPLHEYVSSSPRKSTSNLLASSIRELLVTQMEVTIHPCFRLTKEKETPPPKVTTGRTWHRFWLKYSSGCNGVYQIGKAVVLPMIFVVSVNFFRPRIVAPTVSNKNQRGRCLCHLKLNIFFQNTRRQWVGCLFAQNTCSPPVLEGFFRFMASSCGWTVRFFAFHKFLTFRKLHPVNVLTWYLKPQTEAAFQDLRVGPAYLRKIPRPSTHIPFQWISYGTVDGWYWNLKSILPGIIIWYIMVYTALYCQLGEFILQNTSGGARWTAIYFIWLNYWGWRKSCTTWDV